MVFQNAARARETVETLYRIRQWYPFLLFGFVIMPDHCHLLLLVESPREIFERMKKFKVAVSRNIGEGPIWQSRFHCVFPDDCYEALRYIHHNPVVAGLCSQPEEFPWSSANEQWSVDDL
jgi:putative transposase